VADQLKNLENVSFFQADLFHLPFKDEFADIAWSSGVIHHTPDPAKAFAAIARKVKRGGRVFLSVYSKDLHHYRLLRRLMPFARHLPVAATYFLATLVAIPVYLAFNTALFLVRRMYHGQKPPYRFCGFTIENTRYQSYRGILLNIFDQIHPQYQSEHTIDEVRGWFLASGLSDITVVESIGMVGVRGIKSKLRQPIHAGVVAGSVRHTK
jgi:SAM-dependent methyltransferase